MGGSAPDAVVCQPARDEPADEAGGRVPDTGEREREHAQHELHGEPSEDRTPVDHTVGEVGDTEKPRGPRRCRYVCFYVPRAYFAV
ncbi:hypothetical protein GCM10009000_096620 [Halobacterium noricense]